MSLSRNQSFFKQYARNGYAEKMNPEFDGIARKYYQEKKEHEKVHTLKAKLDKEVAFMQRMEKKIQKNLEKKQLELRYAKEVSTRFQDDLRRREWINQYHSKQLQNNQQKAHLIKSQSVQRIKEAQNYLLEHKRSLASFHKAENQRIKEARSLKKAQEWDTNRSRASEIYQFKKDVKESCNKFYQSRTGSSLKNYKASIETLREHKETDHERIRSLQQRLLQISRLQKQKKERAEQITHQLSKLRQQSRLQSSLIRSRMRSHSSLSSISSISKGAHSHVI